MRILLLLLILGLSFVFAGCEDNGIEPELITPAIDPENTIYLKSGTVTLYYSIHNLNVVLESGSCLHRIERNWNDSYIQTGHYEDFHFNSRGSLTMTIDSLDFGIDKIQYYSSYTGEREAWTFQLAYDYIPPGDSLLFWRIDAADIDIEKLDVIYNQWSGFWIGYEWHSSATAITDYFLTDSTYIEARMVFD